MTALAIVTTPEELEELVRRALRAELQRKAEPEWLPIKEFAKRIDKSPETVRRYIRNGELTTRDVCGTIYVQSIQLAG